MDPEAKDLYVERAWEALDWKAIGGNFAYPWYLNTGPSLFNTELFEKVDLDPEKLPTNYDELFEQANVMAEKAGGDFAMIGATPIIEDFGEYGVEVMNADETEYTFNNDKGVDDNFQSARIAYMSGSAYNIEQIEENAPSVYEHLVFQDSIYNTSPNMHIQSIGVNADTDNAATALEFAKFVTNAGNQLAFAKEVSIFPSSKGTLDDPFFEETDGSDAEDVRVLAAKQFQDAVVYAPPTWTEPMEAELRTNRPGLEG